MPRFWTGCGRLSSAEDPLRPPRPAPSYPGRPVFLARASYRQRRLHDAARLAPTIGAGLWLLPLLWPRGDTPTSVTLIYLFAVWVGLTGLSALLSRALRGAARRPSDPA